MHHDNVMIDQDLWDKLNGAFVLFLGLSNAFVLWLSDLCGVFDFNVVVCRTYFMVLGLPM